MISFIGTQAGRQAGRREGRKEGCSQCLCVRVSVFSNSKGGGGENIGVGVRES